MRAREKRTHFGNTIKDSVEVATIRSDEVVYSHFQTEPVPLSEVTR